MEEKTFLGGDFRPYNECQMVVFPCPYEKTTSYMKGTVKGPDAIIEASEQVEYFDSETGLDVSERGVYLFPPFQYEGVDYSALLNHTYEKMLGAFRDKKFVLMLGGEHTISISPIRAAAEAYGKDNVSILHLDAHSDMRSSYGGTPHSHACIMRRAHEVIEKSYSVGIRAQCEEEREYINANKKRFGVQYDHERAQSGLNPDEALKYLDTEYVYVTIDLDYFNPSEMPSVGTPVPGGGTWHETLRFLRAIFEKKKVIGADIVELKPDHNTRSDYYAAQLAYKLMTYRFING